MDYGVSVIPMFPKPCRRFPASPSSWTHSPLFQCISMATRKTIDIDVGMAEVPYVLELLVVLFFAAKWAGEHEYNTLINYNSLLASRPKPALVGRILDLLAMEETTGGSVWGASEFSFTEDEQVEPTSPNQGQSYLDPYHFYEPTTVASYPSLSSFGMGPADLIIPNLSPAFLPWPINDNIPAHMLVHDNNVNPQATVATFIPSHGHPQEYPHVPNPNIQHPSQSPTNNNTLTTPDQNYNTQHKTTRATKAL
ncbi:unnamed protein product [Aspergillus oryzae var. brunneus]|uniref:Unnamed protein product n=1 Tax=Aspergillus oryzae var. brunneus TaxID=332754 RepID=A0ABQ6KWK3_ASPOZ|nr:unnamed protein product [Aspergillus oryzae]GMG46405.1 unnamed protein product [Aspergillus oryzae var. brunneus]